jgi:hypothetical protein
MSTPGTSLLAPRYYVILTSSLPSLLVLLLWQNSAKMTDGYGGWEVIERPRRVGLVNYKGLSPLRMDIQVVFEGLANEEGQEANIAILEAMAMPAGDNLPPPTVNIIGPMPHTDVLWVIESIDWDETTAIWDVQGNSPVRLRQVATIHLLQMVNVDILVTSVTPAVRANGNSGGGKSVVSKGTTAKDIAKDQYGDQNLWSVIAGANPWIQDPRVVIPAGQPIIIPPKAKAN